MSIDDPHLRCRGSCRGAAPISLGFPSLLGWPNLIFFRWKRKSFFSAESGQPFTFPLQRPLPVMAPFLPRVPAPIKYPKPSSKLKPPYNFQGAQWFVRFLCPLSSQILFPPPNSFFPMLNSPVNLVAFVLFFHVGFFRQFARLWTFFPRVESSTRVPFTETLLFKDVFFFFVFLGYWPCFRSAFISPKIFSRLWMKYHSPEYQHPLLQSYCGRSINLTIFAPVKRRLFSH